MFVILITPVYYIENHVRGIIKNPVRFHLSSLLPLLRLESCIFGIYRARGEGRRETSRVKNRRRGESFGFYDSPRG